MLTLQPFFNSTCEKVLEFKTCCGLQAFDQNFEIHVTNGGDHPAKVPSYLDLIGPKGSVRIDTLMPYGEVEIAPGETKAFYCTMDEPVWVAAQELAMYDQTGNRYAVVLHRDSDRTE